jgi:hypothetical protein
MLQEIHQQPRSVWRRIELESIARAYRTPRILDHTITLRDYDGPIRQIVVTDLGHEEPTFVLTSQLSRSAVDLVGRCHGSARSGSGPSLGSEVSTEQLTPIGYDFTRRGHSW